MKHHLKQFGIGAAVEPGEEKVSYLFNSLPVTCYLFVDQRLALPGYEAVSEWVTERVLREDKSHSTGLTMRDPDILVPYEQDGHSFPVMHNVEGKTHKLLEKLKIMSRKYT